MSVAALEAALAASPDDPLLLAAFADALADAGDSRGEFVRLQLAHDDPGCANRPAVERRLRSLWLAHSGGWITPDVRQLGKAGFYSQEGAVPLLRVKVMRPWAGAVVAGSPLRWLLRGVRLDDVSRWAEAPAEAEQFFDALARSRVRTLAVCTDRFGDGGLADLLASDLFARLTELHLPGCGITDSGADALATHPHTPKLRPLDLDANLLSPVGHGWLAAVGVAVSERQCFMPGGWDFDPSPFR